MYKILVLHAVEDNTRRAVLDHVYCYPQYGPGNLYVYQHLFAPVTEELAAFPFDAIIINYCFLSYRVVNEWQAELRQKFSFVTHSPAVKIALAQDECTASAVMDEWLYEFLKVDVIYTPYTRDLEALYPQCFGRVPIKHAFAGYSNPKEVARLERFVLPFGERPIDVGSRVRHLPPYFGRHGVLKGWTTEKFGNAAAAAGFVTDVSTRPQDVFTGDDWFRFLGSCRFTFLTRAGASMHDPRGDIRAKVEAFLRENPKASFDEVELACFPGVDRYDFSCVSPRLFEAAAARTGLILLEDDYVDGLQPYRHYIPLRRDFSNVDEVFGLMRDDAAAEAMISAAYEYLIASERFSYAVLVDDVMAEIAERAPMPRPATDEDFAGLKRHCDGCESSHRLLQEAPPYWSQVARYTSNQAQQRGQLKSLAHLVTTTLVNGNRPSLMAAEMASGGVLDPRLACLATESIAGLAGDRRDLCAWASVLADLGSRLTEYLPKEYRYCEYIYDPVPPLKRTISGASSPGIKR